jgi:hypothetical protein
MDVQDVNYFKTILGFINLKPKGFRNKYYGTKDLQDPFVEEQGFPLELRNIWT